MGKVRQYARVSTSTAAPRQVAYKVWQSSPNSKSGSAPKDVKYDISYESSFFNHYFDTGVEKEKTFAPGYKLANTVEPYSFPLADKPTIEGEKRNWIHFYFNSKFDGIGSKVGRPNLNLLIALDVSGSMGCDFSGEPGKAKIEVAQESLLTLLRQLRDEDSFGLVIFNDSSTTIQPLSSWKTIDQIELEKKIMKLRSGGGTDISSAVTMCNEMFTSDYAEKEGYSNRVFFLTDLEVTSEDGNKFKKSVLDNSKKSLWSTVVGIGLDLTQDVIKSVSKTPGCNYCNVRSTNTFSQIMDQEFSAIVTPIAFNIQLKLVSERYRFAAAYGSPEISDLKPGETAVFSTEFPSVKNEKGETRSGVILFRIEDTKKREEERENPHEPFTMQISWEDIRGINYKEETTLSFSSLSSSLPSSLSSLSLFPSSSITTTTTSTSTSTSSEGELEERKEEEKREENEYESSGVRKAILLVRYTDFFKKYLYLRGSESSTATIAQFQEMRNLYPTVVKYFQKEKEILDDPTLAEELKLLIELAQMDNITLENDNNNNNNNSNSNNNNSNNNNNNNSETEKEKEKEKEKVNTLADFGGSDKDDSNLCCICLAVPKTVTLLPCNHKCLCSSCSSHSLSSCPLCRSSVESTLSD